MPTHSEHQDFGVLDVRDSCSDLVKHVSASLSRRIEATSLLTVHFTKTHYWAPVSTVTLAA